MLEAGQHVEKYEVVRPLGEGGMAVVYLVRHTTLETLHALKVLTVSGKGVRERLVDEGRVQARLQHPNIVRVLDVVDVDGQPGLVMDYVDGPDLHDWIVEHAPDAVTAEALFRGIVAGVKAAHDQGLIHRDLKPANVLVATAADGTLIPKVADFGLSKAITGDAPGKGRTRSGVAMGTPSYMAPEQIKDAATVDARADLFSLGCILHELVAHTTAYDGDDLHTIFNAVMDDDRERLPPTTPRHLTAAVDACLITDRDQRVATCDDLLEVLDSRRTWPLPTLPAELPELPRDRQTRLLLGSGMVAVGAVGVGVFALVAVATLWALLPTSVTGPTTCRASGGSQGWARHPSIFPPGRGRTWKVSRQTEVRAAPPDGEGHDTIACFLPEGATLEVGERDGNWVEVRGDALVLPEPAPDAPEPEPEAAPEPEAPGALGDCEGHSGRIGWANTRSPFFKVTGTWALMSSQPVFADRPTEANGWSTDHPVICTLPAGTKVELVESPEKVRRAGHWVPIVADALEAP